MTTQNLLQDKNLLNFNEKVNIDLRLASLHHLQRVFLELLLVLLVMTFSFSINRMKITKQNRSIRITMLCLLPEPSVAVSILPGPGPNCHVSTEQQQPVPGVLQEPPERVSAQGPVCVPVHR